MPFLALTSRLARTDNSMPPLSRLAPENPYPAVVIDRVDTLKWIHHDGKSELNANVNKIAVGGVMWFRDNSTPDPTTWAN